jgi:hypothetical protein
MKRLALILALASCVIAPAIAQGPPRADASAVRQNPWPQPLTLGEQGQLQKAKELGIAPLQQQRPLTSEQQYQVRQAEHRDDARQAMEQDADQRDALMRFCFGYPDDKACDIQAFCKRYPDDDRMCSNKR